MYANDEFQYEYGLEQKLVHVPADDPEGEPIKYYAVYRLVNGGYGYAVMSRQQIIKHRDKFSASAKRGAASPWNTDFDSMALKTVLKKALKYAPKSVEFAAALSADETVKTDIAEDMSLVPPVVDTTAEQVMDAGTPDTTNPAITPADGAYIDNLLAAEGGQA